MPRPAGKVPSYALHKASGQAVVRLNGKDHYLGPYGSPESHERYARLIAEWRAAPVPDGTGGTSAPPRTITVNELILRWDEFAKNWYTKDGQTTHEYVEYRYALSYLQKLYGRTTVRDFGPLSLKAVQQAMIDAKLCRNVINHRVNRIRRVIKWAVGEELAPSSTYESLRAVAGLRYGRTTARESEPVKPVPRDFVEATLPFVSPQVAAMIGLQLLTGMRPCEVVMMRVIDIDMSGDIWIYTPHEHKNRWRGQDRLVPLGPQAQTILRPFLKLEMAEYLFSPAAAEAQRNATRRAARKSPMTPSQRGRRPKASAKRAKRGRYDTTSYRRAIKYGVKRANKSRAEGDQIPDWFPLQLRHTRATEIRRQFGIEAAQVTLGHARADVTQVYAERNLSAAIEVAKQIG